MKLRTLLPTSLLTLAALIGLASLVGGQDAPPATASKAVVLREGAAIELSTSTADGEDGCHLVMFCDRAKEGKKEWKQIEPGETRLVVLVSAKASATNHVFPDFSGKDLEALFKPSGDEGPALPVGGLLYTNTSEEPVSLKTVYKAALGGEHLVRSGALAIRGTPSFKKSLHADFAFLCEGAQVAGQVRFGPQAE